MVFYNRPIFCLVGQHVSLDQHIPQKAIVSRMVCCPLGSKDCRAVSHNLPYGTGLKQLGIIYLSECMIPAPGALRISPIKAEILPSASAPVEVR